MNQEIASIYLKQYFLNTFWLFNEGHWLDGHYTKLADGTLLVLDCVVHYWFDLEFYSRCLFFMHPSSLEPIGHFNIWNKAWDCGRKSDHPRWHRKNIQTLHWKVLDSPDCLWHEHQTFLLWDISATKENTKIQLILILYYICAQIYINKVQIKCFCLSLIWIMFRQSFMKNGCRYQNPCYVYRINRWPNLVETVLVNECISNNLVHCTQLILQFISCFLFSML